MMLGVNYVTYSCSGKYMVMYMVMYIYGNVIVLGSIWEVYFKYTLSILHLYFRSSFILQIWNTIEVCFKWTS